MEELITFFKSRQPVNLIIVFMNIVILLVMSFLGDVESAGFMLKHGGGYPPLIVEGHEYYRLVTSMFLHYGMTHLVNNMLILLFLGDTLEQIGGKFRYLLIYLGGGIAGNILSVVWAMRVGDYSVSAGASGAVFAVVGALIFIVIRNKGRIRGMSAERLVFMAALSVLEGFTAEGIDNSAHIGGLLAGFLLAFMTNAGKSRKIRPA